MTARVLGSVLVMLLAFGSVTADAASSTAAGAAAPVAAAPRPAGAKRDAAITRTQTAAADTGAVARRATSRTSAGTKARSATASRQLETTHIQGDIPVPQVLFVTARDQRRFMSAHHQRYLKTSKTLAEATPIPTRMIVTRGERPEVER